MRALNAAFLRSYVRKGTIAGACHALHMSRQTVYHWIQNDSAFAEAYKAADIEVIELAETELIERGHAKSDALLMFFLKKRKPEVYGDRPCYQPPTQHTTFNVSSVKFDKLSDEGLDLVERLLDGIIRAQEPKVIEGVKA